MQFMQKVIALFLVGLGVFSIAQGSTSWYGEATVESVSGNTLPQTLELTVLGEKEEVINDKAVLGKGDIVYIEKWVDESGEMVRLLEVKKAGALWFIVGLFIAIVLLVNGLRGTRSLISLAGTTVLTLFGLLPLIAAGYPPIITTIIFAVIILAIALFVTHGWSRGSLLAFVSAVISVVCAGIFATLSLHALNLSNVPTDELAYLVSFGFSFEVVGAMLFAGIIVGTLGVVDDVAITQIAIVQELRATDPDLSFQTLFAKAMRVGREHTGALVNTLAFAYIGASLPLFVLLSMAPEGMIIALQKEPVVVEIVRILSGSIGVLLVVPIATALAVFYSQRLTNLKTEATHSHHHL